MANRTIQEKYLDEFSRPYERCQTGGGKRKLESSGQCFECKIVADELTAKNFLKTVLGATSGIHRRRKRRIQW